MNTPMTATHVFFSRSGNNVIDTCRDTTPPTSHIGNETIEEIRKRYPDAEYILFDEAIKVMEEKHRKPVKEITEQEFWYMLEVLPPAGWKQGENCESFKMSERWSGNITDIYARIDERYFTLRDTIFLHHNEIMNRCQTYAKAHPIISLTCCSCGGEAKGQQWYNRDKGYGLCPNCAESIARKETPETMLSNYGKPQIHYFTKEIK